jgi:hypothetical protein
MVFFWPVIACLFLPQILALFLAATPSPPLVQLHWHVQTGHMASGSCIGNRTIPSPPETLFSSFFALFFSSRSARTFPVMSGGARVWANCGFGEPQFRGRWGNTAEEEQQSRRAQKSEKGQRVSGQTYVSSKSS